MHEQSNSELQIHRNAGRVPILRKRKRKVKEKETAPPEPKKINTTDSLPEPDINSHSDDDNNAAGEKKRPANFFLLWV